MISELIASNSENLAQSKKDDVKNTTKQAKIVPKSSSVKSLGKSKPIGIVQVSSDEKPKLDLNSPAPGPTAGSWDDVAPMHYAQQEPTVPKLDTNSPVPGDPAASTWDSVGAKQYGQVNNSTADNKTTSQSSAQQSSQNQEKSINAAGQVKQNDTSNKTQSLSSVQATPASNKTQPSSSVQKSDTKQALVQKKAHKKHHHHHHKHGKRH